MARIIESDYLLLSSLLASQCLIDSVLDVMRRLWSGYHTLCLSKQLRRFEYIILGVGDGRDVSFIDEQGE